MINPISVANTFANLVSTISSLIGVANTLTDGPSLSCNTELIITKSGSSLNVVHGQFIAAGNTTVGISVTANNVSGANVIVTNDAQLGNIVGTGTGTIANLQASTITFSSGSIASNTVNITTANLTTATIKNLTVSQGLLNVNTANITSLNATSGIINLLSLSVTTGNVTSLISPNIITTNLTFTTISSSSIRNSSFTTPSGLTKTDVGLANVDNTSDATKNSATANLYNKTLMSPLIASANVGEDLNIDLAIASKRMVDFRQENQNILHNGAFDIWQRSNSYFFLTSSSQNPSESTGGIADRWQLYLKAPSTHTQNVKYARSDDVPTVAQAGVKFNHSLHLEGIKTLVYTGSVDHGAYIGQMIEGYDWRQVAQQPLTLSFWIKTSKTGTYTVCLSNNTQIEMANSAKYIAEYSVNAANTWEQKIIQFPPSPSTGKWYYDHRGGAQLSFILHRGSRYTDTVSNTWLTATPAMTTANQVNFLDTANNTLYLTGVQLEKGYVASPFRYRSWDDEYRICQRYYSTSVNYGFAGTPFYGRYIQGAIGVGKGEHRVSTWRAGKNVIFFQQVQFPSIMRVSTGGVSNPNTEYGHVFDGKPFDINLNREADWLQLEVFGRHGFFGWVQGNTSTSLGNSLAFNWNGDAEFSLRQYSSATTQYNSNTTIFIPNSHGDGSNVLVTIEAVGPGGGGGGGAHHQSGGFHFYATGGNGGNGGKETIILSLAPGEELELSPAPGGIGGTSAFATGSPGATGGTGGTGNTSWVKYNNAIIAQANSGTGGTGGFAFFGSTNGSNGSNGDDGDGGAGGAGGTGNPLTSGQNGANGYILITYY